MCSLVDPSRRLVLSFQSAYARYVYCRIYCTVVYDSILPVVTCDGTSGETRHRRRETTGEVPTPFEKELWALADQAGSSRPSGHSETKSCVHLCTGAGEREMRICSVVTYADEWRKAGGGGRGGAREGGRERNRRKLIRGGGAIMQK